MHRPVAVSGGLNIRKFKPVGPKVARPCTSLRNISGSGRVETEISETRRTGGYNDTMENRT